MQVILNDLKSRYPHAYKFLMLDHNLREVTFGLLEDRASRSAMSNKGSSKLWIVKKEILADYCECLENAFIKLLGD